MNVAFRKAEFLSRFLGILEGVLERALPFCLQMSQRFLGILEDVLELALPYCLNISQVGLFSTAG